LNEINKGEAKENNECPSASDGPRRRRTSVRCIRIGITIGTNDFPFGLGNAGDSLFSCLRGAEFTLGDYVSIRSLRKNGRKRRWSMSACPVGYIIWTWNGLLSFWTAEASECALLLATGVVEARGNHGVATKGRKQMRILSSWPNG
jgi:hypothetical protein